MPAETPFLYVLGDSISMHYGPHLEAALQGRLRYGRKTAEEVASLRVEMPDGPNGGDSNRVVLFLRAMIGRGDFHPDILLVNCGLHDIRRPLDGSGIQVNAAAYRANLREIVVLARRVDAGLIWVLTTHVVDAIHNSKASEIRRHDADVEAYNQIAIEEMTAAGVPVIDLNAFTRSLGGDDLFADHVHFAEPVRQSQGAYLARWLSDWLAAPQGSIPSLSSG